MRLPAIDGVVPSHVQLPPGPWSTVLDALCALFPRISRDVWNDRFERGRVLDGQGSPLGSSTAHRVGLDVHYYREVPSEPMVTGLEVLLHIDRHLVVVDKPHGLPVTPAGGFVTETLLARLVRRLDNPSLVPLHRIDRETAGLVLFSADPESRAAYHSLFRNRAIAKRYEALAPPLPELAFPHEHRSRLVPGEPFFRMREVGGEANSQTHIDVIERGETTWRYSLAPVTGRKHQLRVHMAALGAPICNDPLYPDLREPGGGPLQLLAKALCFVDPLDGSRRSFVSGLGLGPA